MLRAFLIILLGGLLAGSSLWAESFRAPYKQLKEMIPDRPDFTDSPDTVERGWILHEMTFAQYSEDSNGTTKDTGWNYGNSLFRIGLLNAWEFRLGWNGYSQTRTHNLAEAHTNTVEGAGTMNVGFKNTITDGDHWIPNFGVISVVSLPVGARNVSSETVEPTLKLAWSYDLTKRLSVAGNFNFSLLNPDVSAIDPTTSFPSTTARNRYVQFQPTLSVGYSIMDGWGAFIEYYTSHNLHQSIPDQHFFDTGFTFKVAQNLQFDIFTNIGLTKATPDFAVGTGIAYRF